MLDSGRVLAGERKCPRSSVESGDVNDEGVVGFADINPFVDWVLEG